MHRIPIAKGSAKVQRDIQKYLGICDVKQKDS